MIAILNDKYESALNGDRAAENELFEHLRVRFTYLANHKVWDQEDAQDIVQKALMTVLAEYKSLTITTSFSAWAARVLDNKVMSYIQTKKRHQVRSDGADPDVFSSTPETSPELKMALARCLKLITRANRRYARILALSYQGSKADEMCRRLGVVPNNLYQVLSRARQMLQKCLQSGVIE